MVALGAVLALALLAGPSSAATVITFFNTNLGIIVGTGWDPATGNVWMYADGSGTIYERAPDGSIVSGISRPGNASNDFDLDFALTDLTLGGKTVPANSLLVVNGDDTPAMIYALDKAGTQLGSVAIPNASLNGIAQHPSRGSLFVAEWATNELIEIDPNTGTELARFTVSPTGAPAFAIFYSDVDVHPTSGNLFVVSSSQQVMRELTPGGQYVGDIDLTSLNLPEMASLAFDSNGDAWVGTFSGAIYKLGELSSTKRPPECGDSGAQCTGDEDDEVEGTSSADFIVTAGGNDSISSGGGNDTIDAGDGDDGIAAGAGADHVLGGEGDDTILGDSNAPYVTRATEGASGDELLGGAGEDTISGEAGGDELQGGADADAMSGGAGDDVLKGGSGKDVVKGGGGFDVINGGDGRDTCHVDSKREERRAKDCERFRRSFRRSFSRI